MTKITTIICASSVMLALSTANAFALADTRDVVTTKTGNILVNTFGNCVRTKWETPGDACGTPAVVAIEKKRIVAEEDRVVYFDFNKSTLDAEAKTKLDSLARVLKTDKQVKGAQVIGYADRMGTTSYNAALSKKRAKAVSNYLVKRGFINSHVAETRWLGESKPVTSCPATLSRAELISCLRKDRRVEVEIDYLPEGRASGRR